MASNVTPSSSSSSVSVEESRPQAGPLPSKRGEIGYQEGQVRENGERSRDSSGPSLPARHPADRDPQPTDENAPTTPPTVSDTPITQAPTSDSSSTRSTSKRSFISFLTPASIYGLRVTSLLICIAHFLLFGGTIAGWVLTAKNVGKTERNDPGSPDDSQSLGGIASTSIFIHIAFAVCILPQLLFLERAIYRLRAERYLYLHPGAVLPRSLRRYPSTNQRIAFAPWNRPPLPTYAAALAESGHGTGDVEDSAIAIPPPPAYGNTRGSMLLLSGHIRNSLRAQLSAQRSSTVSERSDRPVSYMSHDSSWDEARDAERVRKLEDTLAQLEEGRPSHRAPTM
ncbi:hypothetical protein JAAARDRAFT_467184 [Jaapia argillacea MUCL 33604]|uniref:Uncharacterized protein n=1 Tax=Jaapia argillacea MUCL 33604 TaxID=933084 RepID=A0A067QJ38_9AGAM|nr:hypothetical protein JAAARDRAFT_467184 [Jaapia argillacea MUCL 33604]